MRAKARVAGASLLPWWEQTNPISMLMLGGRGEGGDGLGGERWRSPVTYPMDVIRRRLQVDAMPGSPYRYTGIIGALKTMWAREGTRAPSERGRGGRGLRG